VETDQRMNLIENSSCLPSLMHRQGVFITDRSEFTRSHKMLHEVETEALAAAKANGTLPSKIMMAIRQDRQSDP